MGDLAGLDIGWRIRKERGTTARDLRRALRGRAATARRPATAIIIYEAGSRVPRPDPEVDALIVATSQAARRQRAAPSDRQEIVERMLYPMINEGARILEEGIAMRPGDIDVVWVYGYGWPVARGGPMYYADRVGLAEIAARLSHYAGQVGDESLAPAPLLARLAAEGQRLRLPIEGGMSDEHTSFPLGKILSAGL